MEYGAHLPLVSFAGESWDLARLKDYASAAASLGYRYLTANDHFVFPRPWLDGPAALASVIDRSGDMTLATTVAVPAIRGPVAVAKTAAAIDLLSGGRMVLGVGPGSSQRDYDAVSVPFEERWSRLDEAVRALRALLREDEPAFQGRFYSTAELKPQPATRGGLPIWIGSWGSDAGMRRVARLGDGWLASAYNTTPALFGEGLVKLRVMLKERRRDPENFPNAIATAWMYISEDPAESERVLREILAASINRPPEELRERVLVGSPKECAARISAFAQAGAQRIFVWPLADDLRQLEAFAKRVEPLVAD